MLKIKLLVVALGMLMLLAVPAFADGWGPHHGNYPHHQAYYYGGHPHYYAPPVYRPRVVYPAPYIVTRPLYAAPVYGPVYPNYGYYGAPGGSLYLQGRNFSIGVGF
jgi:hypothetical protein